jgi:DNA repair exonuclease SbcCD ATPase subunit
MVIPTDLIFYFIELSGFMSFPPKKPQRINLNTNRITTIIGENLDVGDGERNGVGKSAIIDAILYLFFGRSPRVSNQGFLNYVDPGTMFVVGEASRNSIRFRVERGENPAVLRLFEKSVNDERDWRTKGVVNGKTVFIFEKTKSSKPETTKYIVELLGFDLKLHDVLLVNNPSDRSCFFLKVEEDQRNIIERIFGFTVLTEKADSLRELRKEETKNLATKKSALEATRLANDRVMAQIAALDEKSITWAAEKDKLVKFVTQQIQTYKKIDFDHETKVLGEVESLVKAKQELEREINQYRQALTTTQKRFDQWAFDHTRILETTTAMISQLKEVDAASEIEIIKNRESVQSSIREITEKIAIGKRETDTFQRQVEHEHAARSRLKKETETIESQIIQLNDSKCPTCGQDWADTRDHILHCIADLDTRNVEIAEIDKKIRDLNTELKTSVSAVERLERQLAKLQKETAALPATSFKTIEEASRVNAQLEHLSEKLVLEEDAINPHGENLTEMQIAIATGEKTSRKIDSQITKLPNTSFDTLQEAIEAKQNFDNLTSQFDGLVASENPYRQTIDDLRNNVLKEVDEVEVKKLEDNIEHITLLIKLLSDRDSPIRMDVLHDWLPELNKRLNEYLEFLELPHKIVFESNMTATFTLNGRDLSFGNLSAGQRLRVWLASNLAFREIFELINYNINLFFVDEVLDKGMSARGAEVSYRLLEQMVERNKSLFLISHRTELCDLSDHTMRIVLENGLSTIM